MAAHKLVHLMLKRVKCTHLLSIIFVINLVLLMGYLHGFSIPGWSDDSTETKSQAMVALVRRTLVRAPQLKTEVGHKDPASLPEGVAITTNFSSVFPSQNTTPGYKRRLVSSSATTNKVIRTSIISRAQHNVEKCMYCSNLTSPDLLNIAKQNTELFVKEYQNVISPDYLDDYINYCWNANYTVLAKDDLRLVEGQIGQFKFKAVIPPFWFGHALQMFLKSRAHQTSTVCLPNTYLLGFEKCGSTYLFCTLSKLIKPESRRSIRLQAIKEPFFWAPFNYDISPPDPGRLAGTYLSMFYGSFNEDVPEQIKKKLVVIDGTPNTITEWPRFSSSDPELANYCLLPSALPVLFPQSKYIVIMRNPVNMLYSSFWWSFSLPPGPDMLSMRTFMNHSKGPNAFHIRVSEKISQFLDCINNHPSVVTEPTCKFVGEKDKVFSECIYKHTHLLSLCVNRITSQRKFAEAVLHRGIFYVHVRKWLKTVPRERIFFTTLEKFTSDTYTELGNLLTFLKLDSMIPAEQTFTYLTEKCRVNHNVVNYTTASLAMLSTTRTMLEAFFEPFNKLLADLLEDEQFLWQS